MATVGMIAERATEQHIQHGYAKQKNDSFPLWDELGWHEI